MRTHSFFKLLFLFLVLGSEGGLGYPSSLDLGSIRCPEALMEMPAPTLSQVRSYAPIDLSGEWSGLSHFGETPDGRIVYAASGRDIALWEATTGSPLAWLPSSVGESVVGKGSDVIALKVCEQTPEDVEQKETVLCALHRISTRKGGHTGTVLRRWRLPENNEINTVQKEASQSKLLISEQASKRRVHLADWSPDRSILVTYNEEENIARLLNGQTFEGLPNNQAFPVKLPLKDSSKDNTKEKPHRLVFLKSDGDWHTFGLIFSSEIRVYVFEYPAPSHRKVEGEYMGAYPIRESIVGNVAHIVPGVNTTNLVTFYTVDQGTWVWEYGPPIRWWSPSFPDDEDEE